MTHLKSYFGALSIFSALSACGGSTSAIVPIYAGSAPVIEADYVGKTFPLRFIGRNPTTAELYRGTGTIKIVSLSELEVSLNGVSDTLFEVGGGYFPGTVVDGQLEVYSSILNSIQVDGTEDQYLGFFGFETNPSSVPNSDVTSYVGTGTSTIVFTNGALTDSLDGDAILAVNFGTGGVSGAMFSSPDAIFELSGGSLSGNRITGGVRVLLSDGGGGFDEYASTNDAAEAFLFGNDLSVMAGTYQATFDDISGTLSVVGAFAGDQVPP